ncbi:MAG: ABC transporter permease [Prevotellaceae bacterium]|nr:ABC transporter permease [Prevotellaceae bacterium]
MKDKKYSREPFPPSGSLSTGEGGGRGLLNHIKNIADIWWQETIAIFKDSGALLFCIALPLAYPILYSWIYNNEVVREVPVVVVDDSHSALSREFIQRVDASPDVSVAFYAGNLHEAQSVIGHGDAYGILYFPRTFATSVGRHEQSHVSVYCDMSYMLTYKAIFQTAQTVSSVMGAKIQVAQSGTYTNREAEISAKPLDFEEVPIFNTTGGYGNFILPAVLVLIIQQSLLLSVGLLSGTQREKHFPMVKNVIDAYFGKGLAFCFIYAVMLAYTTLVVPRLFGFVMMVHFLDWVIFMTPYLIACVGFAVVGSEMIRFRENVMLTAVCTSIPFLFLSGLSWPQSGIPGFWQGVAQCLPSTFAIRGFVRMSSMGARIGDVLPEFRALSILAIVYCLLALGVMYRRYLIRQQFEDVAESRKNRELEANKKVQPSESK